MELSSPDEVRGRCNDAGSVTRFSIRAIVDNHNLVNVEDCSRPGDLSCNLQCGSTRLMVHDCSHYIE